MIKSYDKTLADKYIVFNKEDARKYLSKKEYDILKKLYTTIQDERIRDGKKDIVYYACDTNNRYADKIAKYIQFGSQFYDEDMLIRRKYKYYDPNNKHLLHEELEENWKKLYDKADEYLKNNGVKWTVDREEKRIQVHGTKDGPYCVIKVIIEGNRHVCKSLKELCEKSNDCEFIRVGRINVASMDDSQTTIEKSFIEYRLHMKKMLAEEL